MNTGFPPPPAVRRWRWAVASLAISTITLACALPAQGQPDQPQPDQPQPDQAQVAASSETVSPADVDVPSQQAAPSQSPVAVPSVEPAVAAHLAVAAAPDAVSPAAITPSADLPITGTLKTLSGAPVTGFEVRVDSYHFDTASDEWVNDGPVPISVDTDGTFMFLASLEAAYDLQVAKDGIWLPLTSPWTKRPTYIPSPDESVPSIHQAELGAWIEPGDELDDYAIVILDTAMLTWSDGLEPLGDIANWGEGAIHRLAGEPANVTFKIADAQAHLVVVEIVHERYEDGYIPPECQEHLLKPGCAFPESEVLNAVVSADGIWTVAGAFTAVGVHFIEVMAWFEGALFRHGFVVHVMPAELASIDVFPDRTQVSQGETVCFDIALKDSHGNLIPVDDVRGGPRLTSSWASDAIAYDSAKNRWCSTFLDADGTARTMTVTDPETGTTGTATITVKRGLATTGPRQDCGGGLLMALGLLVSGIGLVTLRSRGRRPSSSAP